MLQTVIATLLVAFAAVYAAWYWMPERLRLRLGWVHRQLSEKPGCGACSSCSGCGAAAAPAPVAIVNGAPKTEGAAKQREPLWIKPVR